MASLREDIIIPRKYINKALDGDLVEISVHNKKKNVEAHVDSIILRADKEYVGILEKKNDFAFVNCKNSRTYTDFFIEKKEVKDYNNGEKVVVKFKSWDDNKDSPDGKIIKSLGIPGETETEIHAILHDYALPYEFPSVVIEEASYISSKIDKREIKKRKDFRKSLTFTIDPRTAKDFDLSLIHI